MDLKVTPICRLCLSANDDVVNIWGTYDDSAIASILAQHFWFQIHKNDGLTEWICRTCWIQTKTFHEFYRQVQQYQKCFWDSMKEDCGANDGNDVLLASDLNMVKVEEPELTIDSQILEAFEEQASNCSDNRELVTDDRISDDEEDQPSDRKFESDDDRDPSKTLSEKAKQDAQIRELFTMKCDICSDVEFESILEARRHYRQVHKMKGYLMCCGRKFRRNYLILNHVQIHINPDVFRCDQCDKCFRSKDALKAHIKNHVPLDSRAYKCDLCSSSFAQKGLLTLHVKNKHTSKTGEKFPCDKCDKNFRSKLLLSQHIRYVHETMKHVCEICARQFTAKHSLESHISNEHSTTPMPKIQCNICGAWLKTESSLREHKKSQHQKGEPVKCSVCNKIMRDKKLLGGHMRSAHGERRHPCVLCEKAFKTALTLKEHIAWHTGEYLYNCPYCEKKFNSNGNLYSHRKKAHLAEWTRVSKKGGVRESNVTSMKFGTEIDA